MKDKNKSRFSAKLLFQYRIGDAEKSKFRICEERVITLRSNSAKQAIDEAKKKGLQAQARYKNDHGETVYIEFVGLLDLMELGIESEENEVWYDIRRMLQPMERRREIIPLESILLSRKMR